MTAGTQECSRCGANEVMADRGCARCGAPSGVGKADGAVVGLAHQPTCDSFAPIYPAMSQVPRYNSLAIVAFIGSFFIALIGIVCGHIALSQIKRTGERGRGFAIAALVVGYSAFVFVIGLVIFVWVFLASLASTTGAASNYAASVPGGTQPYYQPSAPGGTPLVPPTSPSTDASAATNGTATFQSVGSSVSTDCPGAASGQVAQFLASSGCQQVVRTMYMTTFSGRSVLVATAVLSFPDAMSARAFPPLILANNTGDVRSLLPLGADLPNTFASDPTYRAGVGANANTAYVMKAMWLDGTPTHADDPQLLQVLAGIPVVSS